MKDLVTHEWTIKASFFFFRSFYWTVFFFKFCACFEQVHLDVVLGDMTIRSADWCLAQLVPATFGLVESISLIMSNLFSLWEHCRCRPPDYHL